jgi:hypothetical protein
MKKAALALVIGLIALTGCAHRYVIRLDNGTEITTASKPVLKEGTYSFKDAKGEEQFVGLGGRKGEQSQAVQVGTAQETKVVLPLAGLIRTWPRGRSAAPEPPAF